MESVLVTNVGGTLAQGALRTWRTAKVNARFVGLQWQQYSAANLLCDKVYRYPSSYQEDGEPDLEFLKKICVEENIKLIVPTTDSDTYFLQKYAADLPQVACSDQETSLAFYDKLLTWKRFREADIPFAQSCLPSQYTSGQYPAVIAKPRRGGLSRDIYRNPQHPQQFPDDFLLQELVDGTEITVGFYVKRNGILHGFVVLERSLTRGSTSAAVLTREYDAQIESILSNMLIHFPIRGSCNFQAMVTPQGRVVPFEVNGRLSGTNALRAAMGFADNVWLLEEWLFAKEPSSYVITPSLGVASYMFYVVPGSSLESLSPGTPFKLA